MNNSKQIKVGALLSYISIGVNIIAGLLYTPWMIHQIGKSDYSIFTLANSLISMFLIDFGLSSATARYVSKYNAENKQEEVNRFLGAIYKLYFGVDIVIFIVLAILFCGIDHVYVTLSPAELHKFKVVYIIAAGYSIISFPFVTLNGILTAYEKFIQIKIADLSYRILVVVLMVIALLNGGRLYAVVIVNAVAGLSIILFKLVIIKKSTPVKVDFSNSDKAIFREIFGFSLWVTVNVLAQRLIFNITPSILGVVANTEAIAVFGVIVTIEGYTYIITGAINGMFMPTISRIYSQKDSEKYIMPLMVKIGRFQYALNGLIVTGFCVVGKEFIMLWMGQDYIEAYLGTLLVIIPGLFFNSLQIANSAMIVQKKVKTQACIAIFVGIVNVCCSVILSRFYGVIGASFSIFIAYMIRAVLYNVFYYKVMRLDIPYFMKQCYVKMSIPILLTVIICGVINNFNNQYNWMHLMVMVFLITGIYCLIVFGVTLSNDEQEKIKKIIKSGKAK